MIQIMKEDPGPTSTIQGCRRLSHAWLEVCKENLGLVGASRSRRRQ